jgi:hypothetical protein
MAIIPKLRIFRIIAEILNVSITLFFVAPLAFVALPVLRATANSTNPEIPERLAHGSPPNSGISDF